MIDQMRLKANESAQKLGWLMAKTWGQSRKYGDALTQLGLLLNCMGSTIENFGQFPRSSESDFTQYSIEFNQIAVAIEEELDRAFKESMS